MKKSVEGRLEELRKHIGGWALRALRNGTAKLQLWRGSSPHNWWVETDKGNVLWHSNESGDHPDLAMFTLDSQSEKRVPPSILHRDGGLPYQASYALRPEFGDKRRRPSPTTLTELFGK